MATIEARKSCSGISYRAKSKTKCKHHGGRSTGSRTPEGKARQITANTKHGRETRAKREERSAKLAELYELEMLGRKLGLISGGMVGRKALSHLIFWLEHDDEHATARSRAGIRNGQQAQAIQLDVDSPGYYGWWWYLFPAAGTTGATS